MKRITFSFATGLLTGALLFGGTVAYAAGVLAERSTNRVFVDGYEVQMKAYNIAGNNYVKLRDVGKAVGFNVTWDGAVQIDTTAPYADDAAVPTQGEILLNVPDVGDRIICDDGYVYEIKDMTRYGTNVFQKEPLGELPTPTCDWNLFPKLTLPRMEKRHFSTPSGETLFMRNMMETRRMEYTIYNALGSEPEVWRDGKPLSTVSLTIPAEDADYAVAFWPWDAGQLTALVHSRPLSRFYVEAWDEYHDGAFICTRYLVLSL